MSAWTHDICDECWHERDPEREPYRLGPEYRALERCCFCGKETDSGIAIREDPRFAAHCSGHGETAPK